ncbi:MAG: long-chain fatty acid--CoA ligase [Rhodospirillales bacterium]|nr:MAG: long-chain fatty acid--CoA ligase [Rhodospirillales bacterium]
MESPLPPSSLEIIDLHAKRQPDGTALVHLGNRIGWRKFNADVHKMAEALEELGIRPRQFVAVSHPNIYVHWLLLIACEALGAASATFSVAEMQGLHALSALLSRADWVLAEKPVAAAGQARFHLLEKDWLQAVLARPSFRPDAHHPYPDGWETLVRVTRSSGTTDKPKNIPLKLKNQDYWISHVIEAYGFTPVSRYLVTYPFTVNAVYSRAAACLRLGATVVFEEPKAALASGEITHAWFLPGLLQRLIGDLPGDFPKLPELHIMTGGGAVSVQLWDLAHEKLGGKVEVGYGANEVASGICLMDREGVGAPFHYVELKILDDSGQPVVEGSDGMIWLKTPGIAECYLGDEAATQKAFKDGWFMSGDIGKRLPGGKFRILGRKDELLNLGGIKLPPEGIEQRLLDAVSGLQDVGVCTAPLPSGVDGLGVGIVPKTGGTVDEIIKQMAAVLPTSFGKVRVLVCKALPRTENGKLRRLALKEMLMAGERK